MEFFDEALNDEYNEKSWISGLSCQIRNKKVVIMPTYYYSFYIWNQKQNDFVSYFTSPVYGNKVLLGVLIIEIPFSHLDFMLSRRAELGETGEMYLVGKDGLMRSNSRFSEAPTVLRLKVDTEAKGECLREIKTHEKLCV